MAKEPTSNPMTMLLFQGYIWPPYCNARINEIIKPIIRAAPTKSICSSFSFNVASVGFALFGVVKKKKTNMAANPPMGKLT
jgi:hypothetical protein